MSWLRLTILGFCVCLAGLQARPATAEPWLHVRVIEQGHDGETVKVNLPVSLVKSIMPLIEEEGGGHPSHFGINGHHLTPAEMRKILLAVRNATDGQYVTVDGAHEKVRVEKKGEQLLILVDEQDGDRQHVQVRMRMQVLDALLSGKEDELNITAAISTLSNGEELVTVESDDESVRIWVDDKNTTD